jgi:CheY-like chemotaxis protein
LHKLRVLVVEDNGDSADAMRTLVDEWGHEAFAVGNGPAALEHWVGWRADVVLLDIGLPGMSGHQVARRLRELAAGAPLLLVAITGYGSAGDRQASSDSGFDLHLCKPVDLDHLESVLGAHATALHAARAG